MHFGLPALVTLSIFVRFSKIRCQNPSWSFFYKTEHNLVIRLVSRLNNICTKLCTFLGHPVDKIFKIYFRSSWCREFLLPCVALFTLFCIANLVGDVRECCTQGYTAGEKAYRLLSTCSNDSLNFKAVSMVEKSLCMTVFKACCKSRAEESFCSYGITLAM